MMLSSTVSQNILGGSMVAHGLPRGFMDQNADVGHESWNPTSDEYPRVENANDENSNVNDCDQIMELRTAHWAIVEEEPEESTNGITRDGDLTNEVETRPIEASLKLDPVPIKTGKNDLEWKIERSTNTVSTIQQQRKMHFPRALSLPEKELREAQSLSDNNDSQLSPSGRCSRGVQLFHRRRQKLKAFEEQKLRRLSEIQDTKEAQNKQVQHAVTLSNSKDSAFQFGRGHHSRFHSMEETSPDPGNAGETDDLWVDDVKGTDFPTIDKRAPSPSASEEDNPGPLSAYLKETLMVSNSNTNGLVIQTSQKTEPPVKKEQNGTQSTQYCEVHLTLAKPISVSNRTARPFGGESSARRNVSSSSEKSPVIEPAPPPTYAETLSSPPPVTRIRSPPTYSALYPTEATQFKPVHQVINHGDARLTPQPKTGVLDAIGAHRGPKKSMFTFIEKPKMAPNPELLSMVQNADVKKKQTEHGDISTEDESFALGAEASNFQNNKSPKAANSADQADKILDWSSSLKSPGVTAKPPSMPAQTLSEDKGKGAQLFARRQSRMERFVLESPTPSDSFRSPSPTMSLPPTWKYGSNVKTPPSPFSHQLHKNQRPPKPSYTAPVTNTASENMQSQKELELSKRQPYQLQSSLFILSPAKDPLSSLPKAAPPPKPMVLESHRFTRQSSCPTSPLVPSPTIYSPSYFQSIRSPSMSPSPAATTPATYGRRTPTSQVSPMSPVPFSNTMVSSPRNKTVIQAPRPTFSARNSGLESQKFREFVPGNSSNRPSLHRGSSEGWGSSSVSLSGYDEGSVILSPPPTRSMSPAWSERSQSPSPLRIENDQKGGNNLKALIARNIINAAKRKSSSPWGGTGLQSPTLINTPWSPTMRNGSSLPATPRGRRSPTGSDISLESEDSGAKSPGFRSYPFSPRGWYGGIRQKRDSLPSPFTYTP